MSCRSAFSDFFEIEGELSGYDACFFCLGVSSLGMKERDYRWVTYEFALAAAQTLARLNPGMTFIYVSGAGTDSTGRGSTMWARVKGQTENAIFELFSKSYAFRAAYIQPLRGIVPRTLWLRALYAVVAPLYPVWKALLPNYVTTTAQVGRAMIHVAREGAPKKVRLGATFGCLSKPSAGLSHHGRHEQSLLRAAFFGSR